MSRSYRGIFEKSVNGIENILSDMTDRLTDAHRIVTTIKDEDVSDETIDKINEIEYIIGELMNELE